MNKYLVLGYDYEEEDAPVEKYVIVEAIDKPTAKEMFEKIHADVSSRQVELLKFDGNQRVIYAN